MNRLLMSFLLTLGLGLVSMNQTEAQSPKDTRIVGGVTAAPGAWPWQVALIDPHYVRPNSDYYSNMSQFCGGTLIAPDWVLTAAHCVLDYNELMSLANLNVVVGLHDLKKPEAGYQQITVTQIIPHENYDSISEDNDLALLKLAVPVQLTTTVQTVTLVAPISGTLNGLTATVTGWGNLNSRGALTSTLQQVEVPIITNAQCENWYDISQGADSWVTDNMVCAGFMQGQYDACQGDSGGPMVISAGQTWQLAGIVSWGIGCAEKQTPGVYTRVSQYVDWIMTRIDPSYQPPPTSTKTPTSTAKPTMTKTPFPTKTPTVPKPPTQTPTPTPYLHLTITKNAPATVQAGGYLTYEISLTNSGTMVISDLVVTDTLPDKVAFLSADNNGTWQNGLVNWHKPAMLGMGESWHVQLLVQVTDTVEVASEIKPTTTIAPQIVGGMVAQPGDWAWQVALVWANSSNAYTAEFCGGSLINEEWVLTAGHCVTDNNGNVVSATTMEVIVGRQTLSSNDGQRLGVAEIIVHPNYDTMTIDVDVALLHLKSPVILSNQVKPVQLAGEADEPLFAVGVPATVTGWGNLSPTEKDYPDALYQVTVPIVSNDTCNEAYGSGVTENMLCAGVVEGGKDACQGDSGGPLVVLNGQKNGYLQVGIVSWGEGCAVAGYYGVYTRVAHFKQWVEANSGSPNSIVNKDYGATANGSYTVLGEAVTTMIIANPKPHLYLPIILKGDWLENP